MNLLSEIDVENAIARDGVHGERRNRTRICHRTGLPGIHVPDNRHRDHGSADPS